MMNYVVISTGGFEADVVRFAGSHSEMLDVVGGEIPGDDPDFRDEVLRRLDDASNWADDRVEHRFAIGGVAVWRTEAPFPKRTIAIDIDAVKVIESVRDELGGIVAGRIVEQIVDELGRIADVIVEEAS